MRKMTKWICKTCNKEYEYEAWRKESSYCSKACKHKKSSTWLLKTSFKINEATDKQKIERLRKNFEKYVIRQEGCWNWKGKFEKGYPKMSCRKQLGANLGHRASWIIHYGMIPSNLSILHKCDNRICTNPEHLFLGTNEDNVNDMLNKKRNPIGSKVGTSKLDEEKVKEIKNLLKNDKNISSISDKFNITERQIRNIRNEKNWKHVEV